MKTNKIVTASAYRKGGLQSCATVSIRVCALALGLLFGAISSLQARAPSPVEPIDILPIPPPADSPSSQAPPAGPIDVSPEQNTDVSTRIATGCGYDAYSGSVRRTVIDLVMSGAIGSHGLNMVRTYSSSISGNGGWTFSYGWGIEGKPTIGDGLLVSFPDGRRLKFQGPRSTQTGETALRAAAGTNERIFLHNTDQYTGTADLWLEDGSRVHFDRETELSAK